MHLFRKNGVCMGKTHKLTFLEVLNSPREMPTTLLSSWNSAHSWRLENLEARSIANNSCAEKQNTKPELGVYQTEAIRVQSSQGLRWTHLRIWTSKSIVSWLLLEPVVSGSILTQSEVEGSAMTTSSSCCVSGAWFSGEGGFISLTSSLPFSTLRKSIKGECQESFSTLDIPETRFHQTLYPSVTQTSRYTTAASRAGSSDRLMESVIPIPYEVLDSPDLTCFLTRQQHPWQ